jgi:DNA-binding winged helix-turn-helix (wHTH) protein
MPTLPARVIKFDEFELDLGRFELRRAGSPVKIEKVPMELLILLAENDGQLVTREAIVQRLWGDDVFVDTRQGINTAVRKLRLALRDDPDEPRIIQTVFGKGYRLATSVLLSEAARGLPVIEPIATEFRPELAASKAPGASADALAVSAPTHIVKPRLARALFLTTQAGYLALYAAVFMCFPSIRRLGVPEPFLWLTVITGLVGAAVRLYLAAAVGFNFPGSGRLFRQIFPGVILLDVLWAATPLLLFNQLGELSLLCVAALAFLPFSQRTLMIWSYGPATAPTGPSAEPRGRSQAPAA